MSSDICSHCNGSGKNAIKGRVERRNCRRCRGSGKSPEPEVEKELLVFLKTKVWPTKPQMSSLAGNTTGSFKSHI